MSSADHPAAAPPRSGPTYGSYLHLDAILNAQAPLSDAHDEMLFIVIHQASELWIKLCLHELNAARAMLAEDRISPALKMLSRVVRVQQQLIQGLGRAFDDHAGGLFADARRAR